MSERPQRGQKPEKQPRKSNQPVESTNYIDENNYQHEEMSTEEQIYQIEMATKQKRKKILIGVLVAIVSIIVFGVAFYFLSTGLNDSRVVELNTQVASLEASISNRDRKIEELNQAVLDTTVKEVVPETSLQRVEGSVVPELWLIDGDFIAPNKLDIPTTAEDINNSNIQIGSRFKFAPSENWLISVKGTTVEFSHPSKIWGKVRALSHKDRISEVDMKPLIQSFFVGYPETTISYRKMFIEDFVVGYMGKADIKVKEGADGQEKEMTVNVGFAQRGEFTISFLFVNDKDSVVSQELIDLLLRSATYGESRLKLE